jgi:hypothetical protein
MSSTKVEKPGLDRKKEYQSPQLVCYGDVALVTRGGKATMADAHGAGTSSMPCWVAEVLYGVGAPRTQLVRTCLMECYERRMRWALIVVPLYRCLGKRVAAAARRYSIVADALRPLFDFAVRRSLRHCAAMLLAETAAPAAR